MLSLRFPTCFPVNLIIVQNLGDKFAFLITLTHRTTRKKLEETNIVVFAIGLRKAEIKYLLNMVDHRFPTNPQFSQLVRDYVQLSVATWSILPYELPVWC